MGEATLPGMGSGPKLVGRLTVRTTAPCNVFLGTRRLSETSFADLELAPGNYTLVFKHLPRRAA